mgnify:CR=1 FL=1
MNKRNEMRIGCNKLIKVVMSDGTSMLMTVLNYSMGGVGVTGSIYQVIPQIGEQLKMNFTLDAGNSREVKISGIVKYINLEGGVYYLGLGL